MSNRDVDAKIAVITSDDAKKLGIKKEKENLVTIDGQIVDLEWIDEFADEWHLPSIVLKAQAYLKTLKNPEGKKFVNINSNKYENFGRLVEFDIIEGTTLDKVRQFLLLNEYGPESAIDEFNYGVTAVSSEQDANKVIEKVANNIKVYQEQNDENQVLLEKLEEQFENFEISDEEYIDKKSDAIASLKIMVLSIYRDLVLLNSISNLPVDFELVKKCGNSNELAQELEAIAKKSQDLQKSASIETKEEVNKANISNEAIEINESKFAPMEISTKENFVIDSFDPDYIYQNEWTPDEFDGKVKNIPETSTCQNCESKTIVDEEKDDELPTVEVTNETTPVEFTIDSKDPNYVEQSEWEEKDFENQPVVTIVESVEESKLITPVEFTIDSKDPNFQDKEEWTPNEFSTSTTELKSSEVKEEVSKDRVVPVDFEIDSNDPMMYYFNEWTPDEFGTKEEVKEKPKVNWFTNLFRKHKHEEEKQENYSSTPYYLVNDKKVSLNETKPYSEWDSQEFKKANNEELELNSNSVVFEENKVVENNDSNSVNVVEKQIQDIKDEIDALENELNSLKK